MDATDGGGWPRCCDCQYDALVCRVLRYVYNTIYKCWQWHYRYWLWLRLRCGAGNWQNATTCVFPLPAVVPVREWT